MNNPNKKILFLWTLRGLIKNLAKINIIDPGKKNNDLYVLLAQGLIEEKIVSHAELVWIDPGLEQKTVALKPGITILIFKNIAQAIKYFKGKKYDYLFVRGNYKEFAEISNELIAEQKMFYAADPEYYPTFWPNNYFDLIFVDEKKQISAGKKIYKKSKIAILDKPVNTKIFKPMKLKKKYDICYVANFILWKNHQLLFSALDKIPNSKKIKLICVGKAFGRESEINIAAWKYHVNLTLTGPMPADQVAKIINQSKFAIIASEKDANPRTLNEAMACNVPVIVNSGLVGGTRAINSQTGIISRPEDLPKNISWMIKNYKKFQPIKYCQKNLGLKKIINECFIKNLK